MQMKISLLGGCREVGKLGMVIEDDRQRVLMEYGIKITPNLNLSPIPVQGFLDAVIISHAHLDHSGAVPMLFHTTEQPVYTTPASLPLIKLLLEDSIKVNKMKGLKPMFTEKHLTRMMRSTKTVSYGKTRRIGSFEFKFEDAGHILGASSVQLDTSKHRIVFTGDIKFEETRLHPAAYDKYKDVDILITESTYGNKEHPDRKQIEEEFVEACRDVCEKDGNVLVPGFAVGRTQEIIDILVSNGFEYPIYMDGMSKKATEIMIDFPEYLKDYDEFYNAMKEANWVRSSKDRKNALDEPSVIVSTAGMLSGGPAISYLFKMRERANQAVFFSGYQPEHTPGYTMLKTKRLKYEGFDLNYNHFDIRHFDFSAHADKHGLMKFAKKCDPKLCIVVHGEEEQSLAFAQHVEDEVGCQTIVPEIGEKIDVEKYI